MTRLDEGEKEGERERGREREREGREGEKRYKKTRLDEGGGGGRRSGVERERIWSYGNSGSEEKITLINS